MDKREIESKEISVLDSATALLEREWPPCRMACPAHVDVRGYLELIARGRYRDALALILEELPFPGVCGRICHHPCERECRRCDVDEGAAIRDLKRFVAEYQYREPIEFTPLPQTKDKVAVVGAGPSGLTAALELARRGFQPTVFERMDVAGGALARVIPSYRLPGRVLASDVEAILAQGVELKLGVEVGTELTLDDLRKQGYKAIILALGLPKSRSLPITGIECEGVLPAMEFLENAKRGRETGMGSNVVVIGGGNVAIDVARSAVRLGAEKVRMVCLENEEEQPAWEWEVAEAAEEGVTTMCRLGPNRILAGNGKVNAIELKKVISVFDADGRFNPQYDPHELSTIECDTVIVSIGQASDLSAVEGTNVQADERGKLIFDRARAQCSIEDVFACGEVVTGPGSAVEAVANGKRAAYAVSQYLQGEPIELEEPLPPEIEHIPEEWVEKFPRIARAEMPVVSAGVRKTNFEEFELGLSEETALAEAHRCMACGSGPFVISDKCAACLTCFRVCPFDIPVVKEIAEISSSLCQGCGICAAECPAKALVMAGIPEENLRAQIGETVAGISSNSPKLMVFSCCEHSPAARWGSDGSSRPGGVGELYLPDLSRLGVQDMLSAFEAGADGVLLVPCRTGPGRYPGADVRLRKRVEQARGMLKEIGIDPSRLEIREDVSHDAGATAEAIEKMMRRLAGSGE